jgi:hypothetical protein
MLKNKKKLDTVVANFMNSQFTSIEKKVNKVMKIVGITKKQDDVAINKTTEQITVTQKPTV